MRKKKETQPKERLGIQSIEIGARLLDVMAAATGPVMLRDLSMAAGMSPSKARRYLVSLMKSGLVTQDPATSRYELGEVSLRLGLAALARRKPVRLAMDAVIELNQGLDETLALSIWGEKGPTIISWHDSSRPVVCNFNLGSILPLLRTATGRVFLAFLPRALTQPFVERELAAEARPSGTGIASAENVEKLIAEIRRRRLCVTRGEILAGLSALAAPVFDFDGRIVAVITILGIQGRLEKGLLQSRAEALKEAADAVSRRLGFRGAEGLSFVEWVEARKEDATLPPPALV